MAALFKGLLGAPSAENQPSGAELIEKLKNRVTSSTLLEDRRDAVRGIKGLSKTYRREVGTQCIDILVSVVRNDRMDVEVVGLAVEALCHVLEPEHNSGDSENEETKQFSEIFLKNPDNVSLLLGLLEDFDFQVRRYSVCLLTNLLTNKLAETQEAILVSPMAISRVMDLLQDSREVIRNDALLLLTQLTRSNKQIQKIVAFENAFDRLFAIIQEEGYSDGGIIVQDCLLILQNLLVGNNSNQSYFREASLINQLVPFFQFKPILGGSEGGGWPQQKAVNVYHMLKLIRTLVQPSNPQQSTSSCQKLMNQCGLLELLCQLMFASGVPTEILTETISSVAEVIRGCQLNQQYFESVTSPSNPPRPAILTILMSMVAEKQSLMLRLAALYCFQCYVYKYESGQVEIINTLLPSSSEMSISSGQVLIAGLFGQEPLSNWCTSVALANTLSETLKPQLLRVQLSMQGKGQVTLLQQIMMFLTSRSDLRVQTRIGLLILLCTWLSDCSIAVTKFLDDASNIAFLTGQLEQNYTSELGQLSRCLCATLLGICLAYHDGTPSEYTADTLRQIITHRVGQDAFQQCLTHISSSEHFTKAAKSPSLRASTLEDICFDYNFVTLFKRISDVIVRSLDSSSVPQQASPPTQTNGVDASNLSTSIEDHDSIVGQYKELIREQDEELTSLRAKYATLESARSKDSESLQQQLLVIQSLQHQLAEYSKVKDSTDSVDGGDSGENEELEQLRSTVQSLQRVQDSQRQELASKNVLVEQLQQELEVLRNSQTQQSASNSEDVRRLKEECAQLRAEHEALLTDREALDSQLKELQDKQGSVTATTSTDSAQVTELQQQVKQLQIVCREAQEKNELSEKEQEDLLVLLADQNNKIKKYRQLLLENNIEVPEDEESDEDSEEDEEVD